MAKIRRRGTVKKGMEDVKYGRKPNSRKHYASSREAGCKGSKHS